MFDYFLGSRLLDMEYILARVIFLLSFILIQSPEPLLGITKKNKPEKTNIKKKNKKEKKRKKAEET